MKNVPIEYRPIPFWSWNEKLSTEETAKQVRMMNNVGIGGFFMHARGGLQTEYMGEEWFENVSTAIKEAKKYGMRPWAYDENGWPSGFGNGLVNGLGVEYQQKYLRFEKIPVHTETQICKAGEYYFYYEINPFYVDTLDKKVIQEFIRSTYEPYYERFGNNIEGFFTDEPQVSRNGIPWSFVFEEEYLKRYSENLLEHLEELFFSVGNYKTTRINFWKMVTDLFSESYMKQLYDWCDAHDMKLTGHLVLEDSLESQLISNGACMPHYEYFHIPGMDWLARYFHECLTARQLSSVAEQIGKEAVLSETFAACGHNISFAELKGIYEWQMVRGVDLLCQHLEGYSLRGIRKRDYPPAMFYQQPWWNEYDKWIEAMSRIGMILNQSEKKVNILLLHPQTTAWSLFDNDKNEGLSELNEQLLGVIRVLEKKHLDFHFGDETIMERHAKVDNGKLIIGTQTYDYVIDSCCKELLPFTRELLDRYKSQGGKIVKAEELMDNNVISEESITYKKVYWNNTPVHYFVNTSPEAKETRVYVEGRKLNIYTGELEEFDGCHCFEPWGSLMILQDGTVNAIPEEKKENIIYLDGVFRVSDGTLNVLTLDKCDYWFNGVLQEKDGYVLNVCERANTLEQRVQIKQEYHVEIAAIPRKLYLVVERPEQFSILVNGVEIDKASCGYFRDKSFETIDISKFVTTGKNTLTFICDFKQSSQFYDNLKKSWQFESEKNKLVYDMEIEPIYLLGNFGITTNGIWTSLEKDAIRYSGDFVIDEPACQVSLKHLEQQGFPFYCGELELVGEIEVKDENTSLAMDFKGVNAVRIEIGDFSKTVLTEDKISLKGVSVGKHKVKLTLINNLRNLMGPHHLEEGECLVVSPRKFFKEKCVWYPVEQPGQWNEDYCFVRFGR